MIKKTCPPLYLASIIDHENCNKSAVKKVKYQSQLTLFAKALKITLRNKTQTQGRVFHQISKNQEVVEVFNQFLGVWKSGETLECLIELLELLK